ncbi:MAG: diaminopimelate epimerase [Planctomycetes bacterium]|nr:diaminopimelate epimerase [Planctomycetota bacterium]
MQGCGNDYVYVDGFQERVDDPPALARSMSDRHYGVGADGLILLVPSDRADLGMRMFNADGSEGEMCGNGLRCVAKYAHDHGLVTLSRMRVETGAGVLDVDAHVGPDGRVDRVRVDMGPPREIRDIEVEAAGEPHRGVHVSMGNPHFVLFREDAVEGAPVQALGAALERHPAFPRGTNVEFARVLARDRIRLRVWERGSGETLACGTGASATLAAAVHRGIADRRATVVVNGGELEIEWPPGGSVCMTGPAVEVYTGEWPDPDGRTVQDNAGQR